MSEYPADAYGQVCAEARHLRAENERLRAYIDTQPYRDEWDDLRAENERLRNRLRALETMLLPILRQERDEARTALDGGRET